jgi:hypothetical protein
MFKVGRKKLTLKSEVVGWSSVMSDDLVRRSKILKHDASQIQTFRVNFHEFYALFYSEIITVRLDGQKLCAMRVPKMLIGTQKTQRMVSAFIFL